MIIFIFRGIKVIRSDYVFFLFKVFEFVVEFIFGLLK